MTDTPSPETPMPPPAPALRIREAQPGDAAAIAELLRGIGWFKAYEHSTPEQATAAVQAVIANAQLGERSLLLVAENADTPEQGLLGYCAVHWLPLAIQQGWEGYVSELFVPEAARGSGAGSRLLDAAVQAARERGCSRIWLVNNRQRPSYTRGFYKQQGWSEQPDIARFMLSLAPDSAAAPSSSPAR